ncbi:hypothetical protein ACTXT7_012681 [Hymenolepis weldensis]
MQRLFAVKTKQNIRNIHSVVNILEDELEKKGDIYSAGVLLACSRNERERSHDIPTDLIQRELNYVLIVIVDGENVRPVKTGGNDNEDNNDSGSGENDVIDDCDVFEVDEIDDTGDPVDGTENDDDNFIDSDIYEDHGDSSDSDTHNDDSGSDVFF